MDSTTICIAKSFFFLGFSKLFCWYIFLLFIPKFRYAAKSAVFNKNIIINTKFIEFDIIKFIDHNLKKNVGNGGNPASADSGNNALTLSLCSKPSLYVCTKINNALIYMNDDVVTIDSLHSSSGLLVIAYLLH